MVALKDRGFTLVEALAALAILGVLASALMTSFASLAATNSRSERRTAAAGAAQQVLEALRPEDPELMPTSGTLGPLLVTVNAQQFDVFTSYCSRPTYCDVSVRHLLVEVQYKGKKVYDVETVFTKVR